ncbi:uncharacterized protein LOC110236841 [Exaiptasia diaphana]|uniref:Uncharacterized protein n=1 Tax=Exaiptasia diaphana TaxID=2652724 RepID=A0A913X2U9_EXADI|nr:uncharacterized protein LOC110236841 [Exaiptasia diaphana]
MIDSDVQFSCDATSKEEEQHNQVYNNSKHFNHGTPKHQHGIETFPNGYVNGLNIKDIGVDLIKSDVVAPTKEAQYASIVAVPTNPKYSGKVCNQTVLTTFAPVYEENVRNFAHKEYPVYATIDSFRSAAHIPLVQTTSRPHDLNYAELAAFDCNAWHNTKRPPPYEETKYAAVKVPPENH